jgi:hypothetical protein
VGVAFLILRSGNSERTPGKQASIPPREFLTEPTSPEGESTSRTNHGPGTDDGQAPDRSHTPLFEKEADTTVTGYFWNRRPGLTIPRIWPTLEPLRTVCVAAFSPPKQEY